MAGARWMSEELGSAIGWLDRSVQISPDLVHGHYLISLIKALRGKSLIFSEGNGVAMALSPLDPFHYAMLGVQTSSWCNDGDYEKAGHWGQKGAQAPGAACLMGLVAAMSLNHSGRTEKARYRTDNARARRPDVTTAGFFAADPFEDDQMRERITGSVIDSGFDAWDVLSRTQNSKLRLGHLRGRR